MTASGRKLTFLPKNGGLLSSTITLSLLEMKKIIKINKCHRLFDRMHDMWIRTERKSNVNTSCLHFPSVSARWTESVQTRKENPSRKWNENHWSMKMEGFVLIHFSTVHLNFSSVRDAYRFTNSPIYKLWWRTRIYRHSKHIYSIYCLSDATLSFNDANGCKRNQKAFLYSSRSYSSSGTRDGHESYFRSNITFKFRELSSAKTESVC